MNKSFITILLCLVSVLSYGQRFLGFQTALMRPNSEAKGLGMEFDFSLTQQFNNAMTFGLNTSFGFSDGEGPFHTFVYNNYYAAFEPSIGFVHQFNSTLSLHPSFGAGIIYYQTDGGFLRLFDGGVLPENPLECLDNGGFGLVFTGSLKLEQKISSKMNFTSALTYSVINKDRFDGYILPDRRNHNDNFICFKLGIQRQFGKSE